MVYLFFYLTTRARIVVSLRPARFFDMLLLDCHTDYFANANSYGIVIRGTDNHFIDFERKIYQILHKSIILFTFSSDRLRDFLQDL